ncbi:transglycosylase SLT domain-containing protein [Virgisporangium aliadipatigenens]|nr:transglycosylase SLT domain-containing protein [Virgisporangium aliadipatigenens]
MGAVGAASASPFAIIGLGIFMICFAALLPIIILMMIFKAIFGGGSGGTAAPDVTMAQQLYVAASGDGRKALFTDRVPADYLDAVEDAGQECTQIGSVLIASQIQAESRFNKDIGPGKYGEGITQIPTSAFATHGKDDDGNGKTSVNDPTDAIRAQGRYLCDLYKQVETLVNDKKVIGDKLDLTLVAYRVGIDAVKTAGGIPPGEIQGYPHMVRSLFGYYNADSNINVQQ